MHANKYIFFTLLYCIYIGCLFGNSELVLEFHKDYGPLSLNFLDTLQKTFGAKCFIETGTYFGNTTANAAQKFEKVYTVELSQDLYQKVIEKFKHVHNVHFYQGASETFLAMQLSQIPESDISIVFLDAHYSGANTAKADSNTAINKELLAILNSNRKPVILIDDLRYFQSNEVAQREFDRNPGNSAVFDYPTIDAVKDIIRSISSDYTFLVFNDMILAYPQTLFPAIKPSLVLQGLTTSRLFNPQKATQKDYFKVLQAESVIMKAKAKEKESIKNLLREKEYLWHPESFTNEYRLWNALIYIEDKNYGQAERLLKEIHDRGYNNWRILWYLALASYLDGKFEQAAVYARNIVNQICSFDLPGGKQLLEDVGLFRA